MGQFHLQHLPRPLIQLLSVAILISAMAQSGSSQQNPRQTLGGGVADQERIANEVRHEILMLPRYTLFDNIGFKVEGNKVTLVGEVTNPTLKRDAETVVKRVEGVDSVDNRIEALPPSPADDRIRRAVYRAIYGYGPLFRYALGALPPIHIIVRNGRVSLVGQVDSEADKNMAGMRARTVPGVFNVENNLTVTSTSAAK